MSSRPSTNGWVPPVVRVAAVGLAAAGLVVGAGRVGEVSTGTAAPPTAARVAATQSTSYCTGDPFAGGDDETPTVDVAGSVIAHAAPAEVLDGLVEPSDEPGDITVEALTGEPATPEEGTPRSGPTTRRALRFLPSTRAAWATPPPRAWSIRGWCSNAVTCAAWRPASWT